MSYYFSKLLPIAFEPAIKAHDRSLSGSSFGIITEIDVKADSSRL